MRSSPRNCARRFAVVMAQLLRPGQHKHDITLQPLCDKRKLRALLSAFQAVLIVSLSCMHYNSGVMTISGRSSCGFLRPRIRCLRELKRLNGIHAW